MRAMMWMLGACLLAIPACEREDIVMARVEQPVPEPEPEPDPGPEPETVPIFGDCLDTEQCEEGLYCERLSCEQPTGKCVPLPSSCEPGPFVCSCDGRTYPGDCACRLAGGTPAHPGKCKNHH